MQKRLRNRRVPVGKHSDRRRVDKTDNSLNCVFDAIDDKCPAVRPQQQSEMICLGAVDIEKLQLDNAEFHQRECYGLACATCPDHGNTSLP